MGNAFVEKMELSLMGMKEEILKHLAQENEDFKELIEDQDPKDLADIASDDIDRRILQTLGNQEMKILRLIESALLRIKSGHYGICMKCGQKIPKERLKAIPYTFLCIRCKSSEELKHR